jgi:excisionase family DNA binding protein
MDKNPKEGPVPEVFTIREAADFTRLKPATLYAYIASRKIPYLKVGSRVLFGREDLQTWLQAHRVPALSVKG